MPAAGGNLGSKLAADRRLGFLASDAYRVMGLHLDYGSWVVRYRDCYLTQWLSTASFCFTAPSQLVFVAGRWGH